MRPCRSTNIRHGLGSGGKVSLDAIVGSLDFSVFHALVEGWKELTPTSLWQRMSPPFNPVNSGRAGETYPEPIRFIDGTLKYPCGWTEHDYDDARWGIAQAIIRLQTAMSDGQQQK